MVLVQILALLHTLGLANILSTIKFILIVILIVIYFTYIKYSFVDVASSNISIYKDKSRSQNSILTSDKTLEECGLVGSSDWYEPVEITLYYDYDTEYYECPILVSDYYFINRKRQTTSNN